MINIRNKDKQQISTIAQNVFPKGAEIWAYGSRIKGTNHETSDLDLVIKYKEKTTQAIDNLVKFKEQLQASNIPILIQVLDWEHIPESFQHNILKHHEVLCTVEDSK